jgi:hypothetical protein
MIRGGLVMLLASSLAIACSSYSAPAPGPERVEPDHMVRLRPDRAAPVDVTIHGRNLAAGVAVDVTTGEVRFEGDQESPDELVSASRLGGFQPGSALPVILSTLAS